MRLYIEHVFDTPDGRVEGLQYKTLGERSCAIFVYESDLPRRFHMRNVPTDLWLTAVAGGKAVGSEFMPSGELGPFEAGKAPVYVESRLEIPVGSEVSIEGEVLVAR